MDTHIRKIKSYYIIYNNLISFTPATVGKCALEYVSLLWSSPV
jgi:hypothetical protein